jgi:two-component system alkaline phosphatase synthesis response regulator PhoP
MTLINYNLQRAGFLTEVAHDGMEAMEKLKGSTFDLVVLDIMLPSMDGMEVCRKLRQANNQIPVVMLSARDTEKDKIQGLKMGADDYMTKPFSPKELIARIKAVLRRTARKHTKNMVPTSGFSRRLGESS